MKHSHLLKPLSTLLAVLFCLQLSSCTPAKTTAEAFDDFVEELPTQVIGANNLSLNVLFENPQDYGFPTALYELPYSDEQDYQDSIEWADALLEVLGQFPYEELDSRQQLTYDVIKDYFTRNKKLQEYYYLDNKYLGSFLGYQANLPILLENFTFNRKSDLDSYFNILETAEETFLKYAELEKVRLENGYGMSQKMLDLVIAQCETFAADGEPFLIESVNRRIDQADFLSDKKKAQAKQKNETLLKNDLLNAYRSLGDALSELKGTEEMAGLAHFEGGKEYYEALVQAAVGTDLTIREIKALLSEEMDRAMLQYSDIIDANPTFDYLLAEPYYGGFSSAEEVVDYLAEAVAADFPPLEQLNYEVRQVPDSMKENFSPAAYVVDTIDSPLSSPQMIYLNGAFDQSLFPTLMHEGYPGHMYQGIYYKSVQAPTIRYILDYSGYSEGWATYVEEFAPYYALDQNPANEIMAGSGRVSMIYTCLFDIGVHYDGWDFAEFCNRFQIVYGEQDPELLEQNYLLFLESPGNYLNYDLGALLFSRLRERAEEQLGEAFSPIEFHKVILDTGAASFPILEKQIDRYVEGTRASASAQQLPQAA